MVYYKHTIFPRVQNQAKICKLGEKQNLNARQITQLCHVLRLMEMLLVLLAHQHCIQKIYFFKKNNDGTYSLILLSLLPSSQSHSHPPSSLAAAPVRTKTITFVFQISTTMATLLTIFLQL